MVDKSKKRKKGAIDEENISSILQRYSLNTVLSLLQEVSHVAVEEINWREMVKNTATGISGAREYQMLWRHLAYGETLVDQIDHDQSPMDDDSDLEYELEPFPAAGREATAEAAACVKVLISSGYSNDSPLPNNSTIEAPLSISIPSSNALSTPSDSSLLGNARQWTNITIPVSLQKVPSSGFSEKRPANEAPGPNVPSRRKRRFWSTAEDLKLTAAVNNNLEPNWVDIAKVNFNDDRKAAELAQRWSTLKRKHGHLKMGPTSHLPETLAATHRAVSMALDMHRSDNLISSSVGTKSQQQPQKPAAPPDQPLGRGGPPKPQMPMKRPPMNPTPIPDSMVKAAAVAAGARIASSADASSLLEAARSPNVVHITTGGGSSLMRPAGTNITSQLPSNVHFIRNGLAKAAISKNSAPKPNISHPGEAQRAPQGHPIAKPAVVVPTLGNNAIKEVVKSNQVVHQSESQPEKAEKRVEPAGEAKDDGVALPSSEAEDNSGKKNTDNEGLPSENVDEVKEIKEC